MEYTCLNFTKFSQISSRHNYNTRNQNDLVYDNQRLAITQHYILFVAPRNWNQIPVDIKISESVNQFKRKLYIFFSQATSNFLFSYLSHWVECRHTDVFPVGCELNKPSLVLNRGRFVCAPWLRLAWKGRTFVSRGVYSLFIFSAENFSYCLYI